MTIDFAPRPDYLRDFPEDAKHDAGYQLDKVQRGMQPDDFKPMPRLAEGLKKLEFGMIVEPIA